MHVVVYALVVSCFVLFFFFFFFFVHIRNVGGLSQDKILMVYYLIV